MRRKRKKNMPVTGLAIAGVALVIVIAIIVVGGVAFYNGKGPSSCRARRLLKRKIARLTTSNSDYHCHREHATMKLVCHTHAWKRKHRHENELGQVLEANDVTGKQDDGEVDTLPI